MNNLEYDHADIFDSVKDIQKQFHHLVRTVPGKGLVVMPNNDKNLDGVIKWAAGLLWYESVMRTT